MTAPRRAALSGVGPGGELVTGPPSLGRHHTREETETMAKRKTKTAEPDDARESPEDAPEEPEAAAEPDAAEAGAAGAAATVERPHEPTEEEQDAELEDPEALTAEDAPEEPEAEPVPTEAEVHEAVRQAQREEAEKLLDGMDPDEVPTLSTDHEFSAYTSGYRAGSDDPGYLLTLAELGRHLGSFFTPEEEAAFGELAPADFWARWHLGYIDGVAQRKPRTTEPRTTEEMDW